MQLVHGTRMIVDQSQPMNAPYVICFTNGCMADYEASAELIGKLKKGQNLSAGDQCDRPADQHGDAARRFRQGL